MEKSELIKKASSNPHNYREVLYGETAYSAIYSYVVVDELIGRNSCLCWYVDFLFVKSSLLLTKSKVVVIPTAGEEWDSYLPSYKTITSCSIRRNISHQSIQKREI